MAASILNERVPEVKGTQFLDLPLNETPEDKQLGITDLSNFVFKRVLSDNGQRKLICVEGTLNDREGKAVLLLEKTPFNEQVFLSLCTENSKLVKQFINDVYGSYECFPEVKINGIKATLIFPATDRHISKFEWQPVHIIEETAELYNTITLPHLITDQLNLQWVYNVLERKAEVERIVYEDLDPDIGFWLAPDLKWDGKQTETLYLLAIVRPRDIKSLRDLTAEHIPLLTNLRDKATEVIFDKYKLPKSQLRIYLHYQPSFYHLHVHFTYLRYEAPGIFAEKSHLLSTVISNLEQKPDYYQLATLPFLIKETDKLFIKYEERGIVKKLPVPDPVETDNESQSTAKVELEND